MNIIIYYSIQYKKDKKNKKIMDALILAIQNYVEKELKTSIMNSNNEKIYSAAVGRTLLSDEKEDLKKRYNESILANNELTCLFTIIKEKSRYVKIKNHDLSLLIQQETRKRHTKFLATGT